MFSIKCFAIFLFLDFVALSKQDRNHDTNSKYISFDQPETQVHLTDADFQAAKCLKKSDQEKFEPSKMLRKDLFQGDIIGSVISPSSSQDDSSVMHSAIRRVDLHWPNAEVSYVISSRYTNTARQIIAAAIASFHQETCLRFVPRTNQADYISITPIDGCYSYVGRQGGVQEVSLTSGCFQTGTVIHELLHAIGYIHEQSRPDRDGYVEIIWSNIIPNLKDQFGKYSSSAVDVLNTKYDYGSVMHYGLDYFTRNGRPTLQPKQVVPPGITIGQREGFSLTDIIRVNRLYQCTITSTSTMSATTEATSTTSGTSAVVSTSSTDQLPSPSATTSQSQETPVISSVTSSSTTTESSAGSCTALVGRRNQREITLENGCFFVVTRPNRIVLIGCKDGEVSRRVGIWNIERFLHAEGISTCRRALNRGFGRCCSQSEPPNSPLPPPNIPRPPRPPRPNWGGRRHRRGRWRFRRPN